MSVLWPVHLSLSNLYSIVTPQGHWYQTNLNYTNADLLHHVAHVVFGQPSSPGTVTVGRSRKKEQLPPIPQSLVRGGRNGLLLINGRIFVCYGDRGGPHITRKRNNKRQKERSIVNLTGADYLKGSSSVYCSGSGGGGRWLEDLSAARDWSVYVYSCHPMNVD